MRRVRLRRLPDPRDGRRARRRATAAFVPPRAGTRGPHRALAAPRVEPVGPVRKAHPPVSPRGDPAVALDAATSTTSTTSAWRGSPERTSPRTGSRRTQRGSSISAGAASIAFASSLARYSNQPIAAIPTFNNWPAENELVPAEETLTAMIEMPPRPAAEYDVGARSGLPPRLLAPRLQGRGDRRGGHRQPLHAHPRRLPVRGGPPRAGDQSGDLRRRRGRHRGRRGRSSRALRRIRGRRDCDLPRHTSSRSCARARSGRRGGTCKRRRTTSTFDAA